MLGGSDFLDILFEHHNLSTTMKITHESNGNFVWVAQPVYKHKDNIKMKKMKIV